VTFVTCIGYQEICLAHPTFAASLTFSQSIGENAYARQSRKKIVGMLSVEFGLVSGQKIKRVVSLQLQAESDRAKCMKGDWAKIMNLVKGVKKYLTPIFRTTENSVRLRRSWWIRLSIIVVEW